MISGKNYKSGDIVLCNCPFLDSNDYKKRPALIVYSSGNHFIMCPVTSNLNRPGVFVGVEDGLPINSVIRTDYIFTILKNTVIKKYLSLNFKKKEDICNKLTFKIKQNLLN